MEYIEQKPVEKKPHAKTKKIIITSVVASLTLAAVAVGTYFLIDKVWLDYNNIELYSYAYKFDSNGKAVGTILRKIEKDPKDLNVPKNLRIPRRLGGQPVVEIDDNTFEDFTMIETIDFPNSLRRIGAEAFKNCTSLKSFTVPTSLEIIGSDCFSNTAWIENHEDGIVMVGKFLYQYKGSMSSDTIIVGSNDSVLKTEYANASVIDLSQFTHMSDGVFQGQNKIKAVELPNGSTEVNAKLFKGCTGIEKVILPESVTYIGDEAFRGCASLSNINELNHVEIIGEYAFEGAKFSGELTIHDSVKLVDKGAYKDNKFITKVNVSPNLDKISNESFMGCSSLAEIAFNESEFNTDTSHIGSIGASAFENTAISSLIIPFNVDTLGERAFANCQNLTSISLYENYDAETKTPTKKNSRTYSKEDRAFGEWKKITSNQGVRNMSKQLFVIDIIEGSSSFKEIRLVDKNKAFVDYSLENTVRIPLTLTSLGDEMFVGTKVVDVDLNQDPTKLALMGYEVYVKTIGKREFNNATSLTSINIGQTITKIDEEAFKGCTSLVNLTIPAQVKDIMSGAFENCTSLANVDLSHSSFTAFRKNVFKGCTSLTSIEVPTSVVDVLESSFEGSGLTSIVLNSGTITKVNEGAFRNCIALTSAKLTGSKITTLGNNVFEGCTSLRNVEFGVGISTLSKDVFKGCSELTITFNKTSVVSIGSSGLTVEQVTKIYVPANLVDTYKANSGWSAFAELIEAIPAI